MEKCDYFEGIPLKIFWIPDYSYDEEEKGYCLSYLNGTGFHYREGDKIPWRGMSYMYGKNFCVAHVDEEDNLYLFLFENGLFKKVFKGEEIDILEKTTEFWGYVVYTSAGFPLWVESWYRLNNYYRSIIVFKKNKAELSEMTKPIYNLLYDYKKLIGGENSLSINASYSFQRLRDIAKSAILNTNRPEDYYIELDDEIYDYAIEDYGAFLELVHNGNYSGEDQKIALMSEAKEFLEHYDEITPEVFFKWNETPEEDRTWAKETDALIRNWAKP